MYGAIAGAGVGGYYEGRKARLNARDRDVDRDRELKMRETYDPMDLERAMLTLDHAKRTGKLEKFLDAKGIPQRQAVRADASAGRRAEREVADQGPALNRISRAEQIGAASLNPALEGIKRGEVAADRTAELAGINHPGNVAAAKFGNRYAGDQRSDYDANQKYWDDFEAVGSALEEFDRTGDTEVIVNAYEDLYDDGFSVDIKEVPPSTKGGETGYVLQVNNGSEPVKFKNKSELLERTGQVFSQYMNANQPLSAYGIGPASGGRGMDPFNPNASRRFGAGGRDSRTAEIKNADWWYDKLKGNPDFSGLSDQQLQIRAWTMANYSKEGSPREEIAAHYRQAFKQFSKGTGTFGSDAMKPDEARKAALEEAQWFRDEFYPDESVTIPKGDGKGAGSFKGGGYEDIIKSAIGRKKE